jgi:hypothetical protein
MEVSPATKECLRLSYSKFIRLQGAPNDMTHALQYCSKLRVHLLTCKTETKISTCKAFSKDGPYWILEKFDASLDKKSTTLAQMHRLLKKLEIFSG